ncbi:hypothetical protein D9619_003510 [Psilocybe cf. subviscida]|uniref:F-box domain-containing protein n=1 Tax=Psilocybe cf. subviscida TaxID=2480587 RepID=A0A8H5EUH4_9AGAR|nr:hypothetical protein D9619_003510 [Psilocybe cf. subviscida]
MRRTKQVARKSYIPASEDDEPAAKIPPHSLHAIKQLEKEIERHSRAIVDLKRQINAHLPISSLPVEILCRIFHFTHEKYMKHPFELINMHGGFQARELAWVIVTRVCHRWRDAAVNEPSLWTNPTLRYKEWMNAMLERSRMANIAIRVDDKYLKNKSDVVSAIVRHMPHIAELVVTSNTPSTFLQSLARAMPSVEAPRLEHLSLHSRNSEFSDPILDLEYTEPPTGAKPNKDSLPSKAFTGAAKLRHLELSAINIGWNSHLFSDLTTLVLEFISYKSRPSISQFRTMLERMPNLKSLTLRKALPMTLRKPQASLTCHKRIPLLSLETLVIEAEATEQEFFFNNMALSKGLKSIEGMVVYEANSGLAFSNLVSAAQQASAFGDVELTTRSVYIGGQMTDTHLPILNIKTTKSFSDFTYTGGRPDITHWRRNNNPPSLKLKVHKPQRERLNKAETSDELISSICTGINWTNLCELDLYDLSVNMTRFPETLARTFGTLPNICTVIVGSTSANPFLEALLLGLDEDLINSPASIAFPGLRHLKMWEVTFDRLTSGNQGNSDIALYHL